MLIDPSIYDHGHFRHEVLKDQELKRLNPTFSVNIKHTLYLFVDIEFYHILHIFQL